MDAKIMLGLAAVLVGVVIMANEDLVIMSFIYPDTGIKYVHSLDTPPLKIGSASLLADAPILTCKDEGNNIHPGDVAPECWTVKFKFNGKDYTAYNGQKVKLNDYLTVDYSASGVYNKYNRWENVFSLDFTKPFLTASVGNDIVEFNAPRKVIVNVDNSFQNVDGGLFIQYESLTLYEMKTKTIDNLQFKKGTNSFSVDLGIEQLGITNIKATPYFNVHAGDVIYQVLAEGDEGRINIVPKINNADTSVDCSNKQCPLGFECIDYTSVKICEKGGKTSFPTYDDVQGDSTSSIALIAIALVFVVGGAYFVLRK